MQAHAQPRHPLRTPNRIRRGRTRDHQAGRAENSVAMGRFNRIIDFDRQAEVVRSDDEMIQCAIPLRSRRKAKNSTPSRRRRFIISGLMTISETMDPIFDARK